MQIDGKNFKVRTVIYDKYPKKKNETLLMTHGYALSLAFFFKIIKPLGENLRLVLIDNASWGLNTRVQNCSKHLQSPEASEKYCL